MAIARTGVEDGIAFEDGELALRDGRTLAWRWWGAEGGRPVLRLQGTPGSRLSRHPDPSIQLGLGVRYLQADRPGYGSSSRKAERGVVDFADDLVELLDAPERDRDVMSNPIWQKLTRANTNEALRPGAEGWTDESMALHRDWDFDLGTVKASVAWWHGDDDMNAPLPAARRAAALLRNVDFRLWHDEGHFAPVRHDR